jgi:TolB-like protein/Flp pilus assembly protein TadD
MTDSWTQTERVQIKEQLELMLASTWFASAKLLQDLLRYLVAETLAGRGDHINQTSIAIDVLGRGVEFDPAIDAVVRVEAGRLRSRLTEYYYEHGRQDAIRFELPKGHYIPTISFDTGYRNTRNPEATFDTYDSMHTKNASIAVLSFANFSDDPANEYFSDGISEELLTLLAKIPELHVAARTSSFAYKGKDVKIEQICAELHVAHVLEGSVRKVGNKVRIAAQLIQAVDGFHLWSESWDRTLEDVFAIQNEIASTVVAILKIKLLGATPRIQEIDTQAYSLYLQGRHVGRQGTAKAWEKAIGLYEQALVINPEHAAAWDGLAGIYCDQIGWGLRSSDTGCALVGEAAEKALAIDPDHARAHMRLSWLNLVHERDLQAAVRYCEQAQELDPTDLDILSFSAAVATSIGRLDDAIAIREHVAIRDPVNARIHRFLGNCYLWAGRSDDAIGRLRTTLTLSPGYLGAQQLIGLALLQEGNPEEALAAIRQEPTESYRLIGLAIVYHALGRIVDSNTALADLISKYEQEAAYNIAFVLAFRGDTDLAFAWLDKAVQYYDPGLSEIAVEPLFSNLQIDPRWQSFLKKIGRSQEQLDAIKFNVRLPN